MNHIYWPGITLILLTGIVPPATARNSVTFTEQIAPIVFEHCASCHRPGEAAPFPLLSYEEVRKRAKTIVRVTSDRAMPPWHADVSDFKFAHDRRLNPEQIEFFQAWLEQGTPEGPSEKLPPLPKFPEGWQLGQPDLVVTMAAPFTVPADGPDIYRSFVIPLNLDEDKWVKAIEFRPSARSVVHHCLFFYDTTGRAAEIAARGGSPGFRFLGRDGQGAGSLGGWAVGGIPKFLPDGLAFRLPKGSSLILATHFHPSGKAEQELSTVGIHFASEPPKHAFTGIQLPPAFGALSGIDIPAGATNYVVKDAFELPVDVEAFGVSGHAHYLAKEMQFTATFPNGERKTLIGIQDWDFSWQEEYAFERFVALPKGTRLEVMLRWDNSTGNPSNPNHPPRRVRWGRESEDEMGSMTLLVKPVLKADLPVLQNALRQHAAELLLASGSRMLRERGVNMTNFVGTLLQNNDRDADGKLSRQETPRWLARSFDRLDTDGDAHLDQKELEVGEKRLLERISGSGLTP